MTTSTITPGTGRVTNASAASLSSRSLLILTPTPENPDVPNKESLVLSSSSIPKSAASSVQLSPSNTIFLATSVIPCARISAETADRATLRRAFSALATQAACLLSQDGVPCPLPLETASEEFLPTKDNMSLRSRSRCLRSRS